MFFGEVLIKFKVHLVIKWSSRIQENHTLQNLGKHIDT